MAKKDPLSRNREEGLADEEVGEVCIPSSRDEGFRHAIFAPLVLFWKILK